MRITVSTSDAPTAIGPYAQAVKHGGLLWCSGQLGLRPGSGQMVADDTVAQTRQALENLEAVCREAGTSLGKALRLTVYLIDLTEFPAMNEVYGTFFEAPFPARVTIQAAALPRGGRVEIDAVVAL